MVIPRSASSSFIDRLIFGCAIISVSAALFSDPSLATSTAYFMCRIFVYRSSSHCTAYILILLYHKTVNNSRRFFYLDMRQTRWHRILLRCLSWYYLSVSVSIAICIPSLKAYSNIAASARLIYSLQQSWNFSNVSFCSSEKLFSKSSWCLAIQQSYSFRYLCFIGKARSEYVLKAVKQSILNSFVMNTRTPKGSGNNVSWAFFFVYCGAIFDVYLDVYLVESAKRS